MRDLKNALGFLWLFYSKAVVWLVTIWLALYQIFGGSFSIHISFDTWNLLFK